MLQTLLVARQSPKTGSEDHRGTLTRFLGRAAGMATCGSASRCSSGTSGSLSAQPSLDEIDAASSRLAINNTFAGFSSHFARDLPIMGPNLSPASNDDSHRALLFSASPSFLPPVALCSVRIIVVLCDRCRSTNEGGERPCSSAVSWLDEFPLSGSTFESATGAGC
jgi:hypothetical protein